MGRFSTGLLVVVMSLSAVGFVPAVNQVQAFSTASIYIPVISGGDPVIDARVNLTDVHTGSVIAAEYSWDRSAYVVTNAPAGYYRVDVTNDDYYDALDCSHFRFDSTTNHTIPPVNLEAFPYKEWEWNVSVKTPGGQKVVGATVGFYDSVNEEFVEKGLTNQAGGWVVLNMWDTPSIELVVIARGFETYISTVAVSGPSNPIVTMTVSQKITSFVTDSSGSPASNVVAYLVNTDNTVPLVKRVLKSTSSAMSFDAYAGEFVLVLDAYGCAAHIQAITVPGALLPVSIQLSDQTQRTENVEIDYSADFRSFVLSVSTTWSYDDAYPGLRYKDMGSLRMQIDLTLGDGDGTLDFAEVAAFSAEVNGFGTQYVSSSNLLTVNSTTYISSPSITGYVMNLAAGAVMTTDGVNYGYVCEYTAETIDLDAEDYSSLACVRPDTSAVDYRYLIELVLGYELVSNISSGNVEVRGYAVVMLNSVGGTITDVVALHFEKSVEPTAGGAIEPSDSVYVVKDGTGTTLKYIVKVGANATFSSASSTDPNGNPLLYTWDFNDGSAPVCTTDETYTYVYSTASLLRHVTLTVTDVASMSNSTVLNVTCDSGLPRPVISVRDIVVEDNSITIDQRYTVVFNATCSTDDVAAADDGEGIIDFFEFEYGDGNKSGRISWEQVDKNVTHAYDSSGEFIVVLNVTDVVGHWRNATLLVEVRDMTPPLPVAIITPNPAVVGQVVWFDAANSTDLGGVIVSYVWTFLDNGELVTLNGENTSYVFMTGPQTTTVTLNCTDSEGNWATVDGVLNVSGEIPEFPAAALPILSLLLLVAVATRGRLRRRPPRACEIG